MSLLLPGVVVAVVVSVAAVVAVITAIAAVVVAVVAVVIGGGVYVCERVSRGGCCC